MFKSLKTLQLYPWEQKESIYQKIIKQLEQYGKIIDDTLPDDEEFWSNHRIRFVAGGLDSIFGHHSNLENDKEKINYILNLLLKLSRKPTRRL